MTSLRTRPLLLAACTLSGCASGPLFVEAKNTEPHATLIFERDTAAFAAMFALQTIPLEINGRPPNSDPKWTFRKFLITPGPVNLLLQISGSGRLVAICGLSFNAEENRTYTFGAKNDLDSMRAIGIDDSDAEIAKCEGKKQMSQRPTTIPVFNSN